MILDYAERTGKYIIRVPRSHAQVREFVEQHGLDFSRTASTENEAVLSTPSPYAALTYADAATPAAARQLGPLLPALAQSRSLGSSTKYPVGTGAAEAGHSLYPFQRAGLDYVLQRTHALIGDSPGLGKTPMGIVAANAMRAKRVLVVCPANIRLQWAKQIRLWSTMEGRYVVYPILRSQDGVHPRAAWTIVSYDLLGSPVIGPMLAEQRFDLVILDEAHYLKTASARRTRAVLGERGLVDNSGSVLALTGTPLPNRPKECFTLSKALCWDAIDYMDEDDFQARYNPAVLKKGKNGGRFMIEKTGRLLELQNRLRCHFMVRRQKREVLEQLPEISYEIVHVDKTDGVSKALEAERLLDIDPEDLRGADAKVLGHISVVRRMMGVAKAPLAAAYAADILESGEEKLVIFGWHIEVLDIIEKALQKYGVLRVDGSTSARRRQQAVEDFINGAPRVFLGNLQSVGVGVDGLQKVCNRGLFAECSWTPSDNDQGVGRLERIGQKCGILIEFLVAPGSLDERVLSSSLRKLRDIDTALDRKGAVHA